MRPLLGITQPDSICSLTYPACNAHAPCYPRPAPFYNILPHYLINGTISEKNVTEHKMCVSSFSTNFSEISFILMRIERDMIKNEYWLRNEKPTCHLLFYFTYYALNMFRTLIYPSSRACDCVDELPHLSSCSVKTDVLAISVPFNGV